MYADRSGGSGFNPGSLAVAVGINAALVAALLYAGPKVGWIPPREPIDLIDVPAIVPPPPEPAKPIERTTDAPAPRPRVETSRAPITVPLPTDWAQPIDPPTTFDPGPVTGGGTGTAPVDPPRPAPVMVQPGIDPRHTAEFQPTYPADERRMEREGRVVVRVLVGTDGRVKRLEQVSATSPAFWRATEDRAMRRWRFMPGTRDGVPVEAWRTMTLTFLLKD